MKKGTHIINLKKQKKVYVSKMDVRYMVKAKWFSWMYDIW